jgi:hypothetical protein
MERHLLLPVGSGSAAEVVRRLCGVQAQVASSADLAVRVRQTQSRAGDVAAALADGRLIKTWAMRGTLHLFTPDEAGEYLSLMASSRSWERPIWERYFGVSPKKMEDLRAVVTGILGDRAMTREELIAEVTKRRGFRHIGEALASSWGTVFKPLAWQGDICIGPTRGNRVTFMRPETASKKWRGVPDADDAWPHVVLRYLGSYGPATPDGFAAWLSRGTIPRRKLRSWFEELTGSQIVPVDVEGEAMFILARDADALARAKPTGEIRLLGGFDQWVLGPGTDDGHVTPSGRRRAVSKQSGWIAPVVLSGGVVSGTWEADKKMLTVTWFREAGKPPIRAIEREAKRITRILNRDLSTEFVTG